jgi:hypothetical protein
MNENHFAKLAKKSPYYFYIMETHSGGGYVRTEDGKLWEDEFGKAHYVPSKKHYIIRAYIDVNKSHYKKLENHGGGSIYFTFNLEEDSKIKMDIYSYCDDVHRITNGFLSLEKYISYGEYKKICKNGLSVSKEQLDKWCAEQIKINKEKAEAYKLKKMNEDFDGED